MIKVNIKIQLTGNPGSGKTLLGEKVITFLKLLGFTAAWVDEDTHIIEVKGLM